MNIQTLLNPKSIAIVGVSSDTKKVGYLVAKNMLAQGFAASINSAQSVSKRSERNPLVTADQVTSSNTEQKLYFINPKATEVLGRPCLASLKDIGKSVDLVVLCTPANISLTLLDEVKAIGCTNVVLFAAGFKEAHDEEGENNEKLLLQKCNDVGIRLLGPNCIGFVNTKLGVNATFFKDVAVSGNIGFISQSGALGSIIIDTFIAHKTVGLSYFVSLGNKSIIDETDVLQFLADDPGTKVIGMYIEDIKRGAEFVQALRYATSKKPVIILKSGTSEAGSKAAASHTGGLVMSDSVCSAVFAACGAVRAKDFEEMLAMLTMVSLGREPKNNNVLVLSNAGGVGVLMADELMNNGLTLETISKEQETSIKAQFPTSKKISIHNPIDVLGDASAFDYKAVLSSIGDDKDIGSALILLTPQANTQIQETAQVIIEAQKTVRYPLYPVFMGEASLKEVNTIFEKNGMVHFGTYTHAVKAITRLSKQLTWEQNKYVQNSTSIAQIIAKLSIENIVQAAKNEKRTILTMQESFDILEKIGLPIEKPILVKTKEEALETAKRLGLPVVLKLNNKTLTHKTEVKGVYTGVGSLRYLEQCFDELQKIGEGAYVQKQLSGPELFVGAKRDTTFGTVVILGLGGIYAELLKETVTIVERQTVDSLTLLLEGSKINTLLHGYRGARPVNMEQVVNTINTIFDLFEYCTDIKELDCNPALIVETLLQVVDARVIV
jgi:acetate---CoA ligase (ADP-forming)